MIRVRRALLSVTDKRGLPEFAQGLARRGVEIVSTGGTAKLLASHGLPVIEVSRVTGFPEMMDGRVKTLHPKIHGAILAVRGNPDHEAALAAHGITPIDLVCVNLYAFEQTVARPGCTLEEAVENIDIGGPTLIRAAAKNHRHVAVVTDPDDYPALLAELDREGGVSEATALRLAAKAFGLTHAYDGAIARYLAGVRP